MTGKIIVIEGYDGTGKTTLAQRLASEHDARSVTESVSVFFPNPKGVTEFTQDMYSLMRKYTTLDEDVKLLMFMANHIINIKLMNELKNDGHLVICDRSILSTLAYQFLTVRRLKELLMTLNVPILNYDKAFVLTASTEAIKSRMMSRGTDTLDDYFMSNLAAIRTCYHTMTYDIYSEDKCVMIDTSNLTPDEVYKSVWW